MIYSTPSSILNKINCKRFFSLLSPVFSSQASSVSESKNDINGETTTTREIPIHVATETKRKETTTIDGRSRTSNTVLVNEVEKFRPLAQTWWNLDGDCKPLHSMNKLRVPLVRDGLAETKVTLTEHSNGPQPLKYLKILDVGCGGGILCEALGRLGAEVVGIDATEESIAVADIHAAKDKVVKENVRYLYSTIEEHLVGLQNHYDAVIVSEVLEHVNNVSFFVEQCVDVLKPGGSIFITTLNKTRRSYFAGIVLAEYIFKLIPAGTHDWNKFVPQEELKGMLEKEGCYVRLLHGMLYIPIRNEWFWIPDSSVNYALHAVKRSH